MTLDFPSIHYGIAACPRPAELLAKCSQCPCSESVILASTFLYNCRQTHWARQAAAAHRAVKNDKRLNENCRSEDGALPLTCFSFSRMTFVAFTMCPGNQLTLSLEYSSSSACISSLSSSTVSVRQKRERSSFAVKNAELNAFLSKRIS